MSRSPVSPRLFGDMTVLENLEMGAFTRTDRAGVRADLERVFALFPILRERQAQAGGPLGTRTCLPTGSQALGAPPRRPDDRPRRRRWASRSKIGLPADSPREGRPGSPNT